MGTTPRKPRTRLGRILFDEGRKQLWLADKTGIHYREINRYVHGLIPSDHNQRLIADALGRKVDELWPEESEGAVA